MEQLITIREKNEIDLRH